MQTANRAIGAIFAALLITCALASVARADTARVDDRFQLADRIHVRVFEDGSARVCYRVRVWPIDYRATFGRFTRVCGGVGVPW